MQVVKCPEGIFPQPEMEKRAFQVFGEGGMKDRRGCVVILRRNPDQAIASACFAS